MKDFYYILGAERNCTTAELNAAYRKLAQKFQPANHAHDYFLDSHFQEITEAYQILSDPTLRRKYDNAFKKNYQRRLYYFKIKHLNIIATLSLITFTLLFGAYVIKAISGDKAKKTIITAPPAALHKVKHYQKKRSKTVPTIAQKAVVKKADTALKPVVVKAVPVKLAQPPVIIPDHNPPANTGFTAYLRANVTGVIYLHEQASYNSPVITSVPNHAKVTVLEKGTSFYKVSFNGTTGFVPRWTVTAPPGYEPSATGN